MNYIIIDSKVISYTETNKKKYLFFLLLYILILFIYLLLFFPLFLFTGM